MLQHVSAQTQQPELLIPSTLCFATLSTRRQTPVFTDFARGRVVVQEIRRQHDSGQVDSFAFVVMPRQLHWLFGLGSADSVESVLNNVKKQTAIAIEHGFGSDLWETGFMLHETDQGRDLLEVARFIINNPVRDGIARDIGEYALWDTAWDAAFSNSG
jgi:REP element-mobilizing transposase RayT